jgi:hypothetical protein
VPAGKSFEGAGLTAKSDFAVTREEDRNVLVVRRSIMVPRREIPAADYPQLRTFLSSLVEEEAGAVTLVPES